MNVHVKLGNGRFFHGQAMGNTFMEGLSTDLTRQPMKLKATPDRNEVARRMVALREALGLIPSEFADSVGIDRSSLTKIEKGEKALHADHAFRISQRYAVPMDYLYRGILRDLPASLAEILRKN